MRKNLNVNVLQIFAFALHMWVTIWARKLGEKKNVFTFWQEFRSRCCGQIQMNTLNEEVLTSKYVLEMCSWSSVSQIKVLVFSVSTFPCSNFLWMSTYLLGNYCKKQQNISIESWKNTNIMKIKINLGYHWLKYVEGAYLMWNCHIIIVVITEMNIY